MLIKAELSGSGGGRLGLIVNSIICMYSENLESGNEKNGKPMMENRMII